MPISLAGGQHIKANMQRSLAALRLEPFAPNHTRASEFDTNAILCLAGQLAAPTELAEEAKLPPGLDTLPPDDPENPDFSVLRRKIVEEQRKDPKLSQIIAKLEAAHVVRAELDELTQDDSVLELDQAESEAVADASHEEKVDEADLHSNEPKRVKKRNPPKGNKYDFRLVGPDKLLVKACPYRAAKGKEAVVIWPIVVPESLVPAIIGLFHGSTPH